MDKFSSEEIELLKNGNVEDWNELIHKIITEKHIVNEDFSEINLTDVQFKNVVFNSVRFNDCNLTKAQFYKSYFNQSIFTNCKLDQATFNSNQFEQSNVLLCSATNGVSFMHSTFKTCELFGNNKFDYSDFYGSVFNDIDLSGESATHFSFSNISVNQKTIESAKLNENITIGINGIYNKNNNSAALIMKSPTGDSMLGGDEETILLSLNKAKKAFNISLVLSLISFTSVNIGLSGLSYLGLILTPNSLNITIIPIVLVWLYLSNTYFKDAILNFPYITSQIGAMKIGRFPWLLTRFWGNEKKLRIESKIIRIIFSFHGLLLAPTIYSWITTDDLKNLIYSLPISAEKCEAYIDNYIIIVIVYLFFYILILFQSYKLFIKSQTFVKPILFDLTTPKPNDNLQTISKSIEKLQRETDRHLGNLNSNIRSSGR